MPMASASKEIRAAESARAQSASSGPGLVSGASVRRVDGDFVDAIAHSDNDIDALDGWFEDSEIGQAPPQIPKRPGISSSTPHRVERSPPTVVTCQARTNVYHHRERIIGAVLLGQMARPDVQR